MIKDNFISFVEKYYLNGKIPTALIEVKDNTANAIVRNLSGDLRGFIQLNNFKIDDCEIPCYSTGNLLKMASILDSDVEIEIIYDDSSENVTNLDMKDTRGKKMSFATSEPDAIDRDGKKGQVKKYDVTINLNNELIQDILKSANALNSHGITFERRKDRFFIMFGEQGTNSDKIEFEVETEELSDDFKKITFLTEYVKEILSINGKRFEEAVLELSETKGIMRIFFKDNDVSSEYWLVKLQD